jgi:hypothetical protein
LNTQPFIGFPNFDFFLPLFFFDSVSLVLAPLPKWPKGTMTTLSNTSSSGTWVRENLVFFTTSQKENVSAFTLIQNFYSTIFEVVPDSPHTIGVEFGIRIIDMMGKRIKLQIWFGVHMINQIIGLNLMLGIRQDKRNSAQ